MSDPVYIVDVIGEVVAKTSTKLLTQLQLVDPLITGIHYEYGHITDIRERITEKMKTTTNSVDISPMIILIEDFKVIKGRQVGITGITDMKIIILHYSKKDITRVQREVSVFRPVLWPIYNEILNQLRLDGRFSIYDVTKIQHDMIARPHWGDPGLYGNDAYLLDGIFDGIELSNLQLTTFLNNCL